MDADSVRSSKKIKGLRRWGRPSDGRSRRRATTRKSRPGGTEGAVEADWPGVDAGGFSATLNTIYWDSQDLVWRTMPLAATHHYRRVGFPLQRASIMIGRHPTWALCHVSI
ncbi:hypothetical protein GW17_00033089 [Ensete ventricosum]|nr:hypothetical protein GW17_00033089 [Ensete ventricosum]